MDTAPTLVQGLRLAQLTRMSSQSHVGAVRHAAALAHGAIDNSIVTFVGTPGRTGSVMTRLV